MISHPREWEVNAASAIALQAVREYAGDDPRLLHAREALRIAERPEEERDTEPVFIMTPEQQRAFRDLKESTR